MPNLHEADNCKWHTVCRCDHCDTDYRLDHNEETYPYYCPFCGINTDHLIGTPPKET